MSDTPETPPPVEPSAPEAEAKVELISVSVSPQKVWEEQVRENNRNRCSNCGNTDRLKVRMIVPPEAGGQYVVSNGVVLCRTCEVAADSAKSKKTDARRPINFWVPRALYNALQDRAKDSAFQSMASLVRYLMTKYVEDETRFDDLEQYQEIPGADVKINVWVDGTVYAAFKEKVNARDLTVTDALKALIKMFEAQGSLGKKKD